MVYLFLKKFEKIIKFIYFLFIWLKVIDVHFYLEVISKSTQGHFFKYSFFFVVENVLFKIGLYVYTKSHIGFTSSHVDYYKKYIYSEW